MQKNKVDIVFVVLVYRNYQDLVEFIDSTKTLKVSYKIIVVNAYYDDDSMQEFSAISEANDCIFLNVENKGYSYGNNYGIEYAEKYFDYRYIIVSNPDILIQAFPEHVKKLQGDIIAPVTITPSGKNQNPMIAKESKFTETLIYRGLIENNKFLFLFGIVRNKLSRELFLKKNKLQEKTCEIYAAHGAFVLLSKHAIEVLGTRPYDENMFLFAEEMVLAWKAKQCGLKTVFDSMISVMHKVDGSINLADISVGENMREANIYYYETYRKYE